MSDEQEFRTVIALIHRWNELKRYTQWPMAYDPLKVTVMQHRVLLAIRSLRPGYQPK